MSRVYNFSAGPAVLPEEVLKEAADEMLDYQGSGQSVMEMSHRSKVYDNIIKEAEKDLRDLLNIPDNYKVLFLQGGASQFFAEVPMNLMKNKKAGYILTGQWAKKAFAEAKILFFGKVLAGTIASLCQAGILMLAIVGAYKFNQSAWGGMLDMLLDIPANVLVTYALFGLGGVLFYTFIYGAFGALVSKTEDINKSAGSIQMVIMIVYFITLFQLMNIDGIAMKVL